MKNNILKLMNNESGSVLIVTILLIVVMTVTALSAITRSTVEVKVASNEKAYNTAFFAAESGWQEVGLQLYDKPEAPDQSFEDQQIYVETENSVGFQNYSVNVTSLESTTVVGDGTPLYEYNVVSTASTTQISVNISKEYKSGY